MGLKRLNFLYIKGKTNVVDKTANAVKSGGGNNKNNNKESKQPSQANSNGKSKEKRSAEDDEDDEEKDKDEKSKISEKWASKFKEAKEAALKRIRQRFDSHTEPQIVKLPNSPGENNSPTNGASSVAKKRAEKPKKPILNKNGEIVYSKFDFTADKTLKSAAKRKHDSSKHLTPVNVKAKDYKSLLKKLKHKREKIEELKKSEPQKAIEIEMNDKWRSAIDKASGAKVKDDPELLAKAIKRREKKKEKSKKAWEERVKGVEERKQQAQEKRKKNLDKRKEKNRDKKVKRLKKKGRIVMGFN